MGILKWSLTILGGCIGGLPGGLVGYWLGSTLEKTKSKPAGTGTVETETGSLRDADVSLVLLVAAVLKADGAVRQSELTAVKQFLAGNYSEEDGKKILALLRDLVKPTTTIDLEPACDIIREHTDYTTRYHMVDFLFRLALADGEFDGEENKTVQTIARRLGINHSDYISMFTRHTRGHSGRNQHSSHTNSRSTYTPPPKSDPYKVLGIERTATDEEVRKAYRRMAMRYHPDKVESLGEEMKKNATEQFRAINEAYETIKSERKKAVTGH